MKTVTIIGPLLGLAFGLNSWADLPSLTNEHADLLVTYNALATPPLALIIRDDDHGMLYPSNEVVLVASEASEYTLGFDVPQLSLTNGQTFWWLRQSQPPAGTLYLGFASGSVPVGTLSGPLSVYVTNVVGPGGLLIWQDLPSGGIDVRVDSRDGLDANDFVEVLPNGHGHINWGFMTSGVYCVTFRVDGTLTVGGARVSSLESTIVFHVEPLGVVTPYALWQKAWWLQGSEESIVGPGADPDGDGLCNAIEYASNLNPTVVTTNGQPEFSIISDGGNDYGALTFTRVKSIPDVTYDPVATSSLASGIWTPLTNVVETVDQGATERVTVRDNESVPTFPTRLYQYRVNLAAP